MDKISEAKLFIEEVDLVSDLLVTCIDAKRLSSEGTQIVRLKIEDGAEIVLYPSRNIYPEGDLWLKLTVDDKKIDRVRDFLEKNNQKFSLKDWHEYGILRKLTWTSKNGSFLELASEDYLIDNSKI